MKLRPEQNFYKIRDNDSGLFSEGGLLPKFSKSGKTWVSRGALKSHLTMLKDSELFSGPNKSYGSNPEPKFVVVEFVVTAKEAGTWFVANELDRPAKK